MSHQHKPLLLDRGLSTHFRPGTPVDPTGQKSLLKCQACPSGPGYGPIQPATLIEGHITYSKQSGRVQAGIIFAPVYGRVIKSRSINSGKQKYVNPLELTAFLHKLVMKIDLIFI
jgi:hypothetical protein